MSEHTDSCSWPDPCAFLERDSSNCLIPDKSGYTCDENRNYADDRGMDAWKPCKYYLTWENALEILSDACENRDPGCGKE